MTRDIFYKTAFSVVSIVLIVLLHGGWLDQYAKDYTEQGLQRVLVTYAVARGLNGVISVVQGTEISVEPVGIGVTFTPGQVLDPVNDLVEQFSWLVLASGVSLGIQRLLIVMTASSVFTWLVSTGLLFAVLVYWWQNIPRPTARIVLRIAMILLVLRLVVPVIALLNQAVYWYFLESQYTSSQATLEQSGYDLQQQQQQAQVVVPVPANNEALLDKLKRAYQSASNAVDIDARLDRMKLIASQMSEKMLDLMVVFVVQSLLFPLLFLWLAYRLSLQVIRMV